MTKLLTVAALTLTLFTGAIATTSTPADANPVGGFSIDGKGQGNPFGAIHGR